MIKGIVKRKAKPEFKVCIGGDPEFFVKKEGKHVSAHDLVPGTKEKPHKLPSGGDVQADGTAIEFNIEPSFSGYEFADNISRCLRNIRRFTPRKEYEYSFSPSVFYEEKYFDSLPEEPKILGCSPDFNAYTKKKNPPPETAKFPTMRTGAGHITIGWTNGKDPESRDHFFDCCELTKMLDGYFSHFVNLWDDDKTRQNLYGAKGAFRPKPFGCEYRVLSNAWLRHPNLWPWIFESAKGVFEHARRTGSPIFRFNSHYYAHREDKMTLKQKIRWRNSHFIVNNGVDIAPPFPENFNGN